jgi:hypothetical protein
MVVVVVLMLVMLMFDVKKCTNVERKAGCHDAGNQVV